MKKCKYCNRDISHKHKNAVFCSNKGRNNCKDNYHNFHITRPCISDWEREEIMHQQVLNSFHPQESGYFGHGQE